MGTERSGGRSLAARGMISTCLTLNSPPVRLIGAELSPAHFQLSRPSLTPEIKVLSQNRIICIERGRQDIPPTSSGGFSAKKKTADLGGFRGGRRQRHLWTAGRTRHWDVNKRRVPHASRRAPIASMAFVVAHSLGFGHERRAAAFPIRHTVERPRAEIQWAHLKQVEMEKSE